MNEKEILNIKVIVYTLLSTLIILAGRCDRKLEYMHDEIEPEAQKGHQPE
ncbi:hypothetical protein ACK8P5_24355 [Paenibacillus sp. EC2-1]